MSRLPIPGQDDDVWGQILNDFLGISHNADGSFRSVAIAKAGAVTSINGIAPVDGNVTLPSASGVQLGGDLGGVIEAPTVTDTHLSSALPINQGGTGSSVKNFVDLSTSQAITGAKQFSFRYAP